MISLLHLNKIIFIIIFCTIITSNYCLAENEPADIWQENENQSEQKNESENNKEGNETINSPILSDGSKKVEIEINESNIVKTKKTLIGIFDPAENNFDINMWSQTDGEDIKTILKRINKIKLSKVSEDLLYRVLFTNAYPPKKNLSSDEFLNLKINWLIKNNRINDLEIFLKNNIEVAQNPKVFKFLINEYLSSANIKSACDKIKFIDKKIENNYLDKFTIYCLINDNRKDEAQLVFDLLNERGFKDKFFEDRINFLLGISDKINTKTLDDNLLNFYLSHITSKDFEYVPSNKTNKYIWRYLSSANLIKVDDFEDEEIISRYEKAAAQDSFDKDEIFKIYLKINFNFNQLVNSEEIYKNLTNYKARALIYQSILLSDNVERKINLTFLLKDLFLKDNLLNIYADELTEILSSINLDGIPENYVELIKNNLDKNLDKKVKFNNEILHRSKVIRHFFDNNAKISRTEKDFKTVYKKIKKNKKYFISIKDIIVLESLAADGISLPSDLDYTKLSSELTVPQNLNDLVDQNQIGLVMLKLVEIIGEDSINNLDPETLYFLNKILNNLSLRKIRNNILSEALPTRI
jgi:hypothetical protein